MPKNKSYKYSVIYYSTISMNKSINLLNFIYQSTESGSNYVDPNGYDDIKKKLPTIS